MQVSPPSLLHIRWHIITAKWCKSAVMIIYTTSHSFFFQNYKLDRLNSQSLFLFCFQITEICHIVCSCLYRPGAMVAFSIFHLHHHCQGKGKLILKSLSKNKLVLRLSIWCTVEIIRSYPALWANDLDLLLEKGSVTTAGFSGIAHRCEPHLSFS